MAYQSKNKTELANAAGVSRRTLERWLTCHADQLKAFGVRKYDKMLPPSAVRYICETFDIDI